MTEPDGTRHPGKDRPEIPRVVRAVLLGGTLGAIMLWWSSLAGRRGRPAAG
jgi:hypothetical protein